MIVLVVINDDLFKFQLNDSYLKFLIIANIKLTGSELAAAANICPQHFSQFVPEQKAGEAFQRAGQSV